MSEVYDEKRKIYLSNQGLDCQVTFFWPLTDEEREEFPTPESDPWVDLNRLLDNGSQMLSFPEFLVAHSWNWQRELRLYASEVAAYLGDCLLDKTIYTCHPDSLFAYLLEEQPTVQSR